MWSAYVGYDADCHGAVSRLRGRCGDTASFLQHRDEEAKIAVVVRFPSRGSCGGAGPFLQHHDQVAKIGPERRFTSWLRSARANTEASWVSCCSLISLRIQRALQWRSTVLCVVLADEESNEWVDWTCRTTVERGEAAPIQGERLEVAELFQAANLRRLARVEHKLCHLVRRRVLCLCSDGSLQIHGLHRCACTAREGRRLVHVRRGGEVRQVHDLDLELWFGRE